MDYLRENRVNQAWLPVILVLMLFLMPGRSFAADRGELTYSRASGCWLADYTASSTGNVYLKVVLPASGLLYVDGSCRTGSQWGPAEVTMVRKNGSRLDRYSSNTVNISSDFHEAYGVSTGTYYLKIRAVKGREYLIRARFNRMCADYGGARKSSAYTLPAGKTKTGVISCAKTRPQRWYRFRLRAGETARLTVKVNGGQGRIRVRVHGPGDSTVKKTLEASAYETDSVSVKLNRKGWYYVQVARDRSGADKRSSAQFSVRWSLR